MSSLVWSPAGIGLTSLFCALLLVGIFKKRFFGLLDPLALYLTTRVAPFLAAIILLLSFDSIFFYFYVLAAVSLLIFIGTLFFATPRISMVRTYLTERQLKDLLRVAIVLGLFKLFVLLNSTGSLPIFSDSGSDSFIGFSEDNKISSSFLLAIGSSELVLLSLLIFVVSGWRKFFALCFLILSVLMQLALGKKSSILVIIFSLSLGEYLRIMFTNSTRLYFTSKVFFSIGFILAFLWAAYLFQETSNGLDILETNVIAGMLDLLFLQWAYPIYLFSSGELASFFSDYHVNKLIYFFHSVLSPLGFPAFKASIGPAFHEYQTGQLTGNGVNPTFILEGYVIFGALLPIYSFLTALAVGKLRARIMMIKNPKNKVLVYALFLPVIYVFPIDALLFMKILFALLLVSPGILLMSGIIKKI